MTTRGRKPRPGRIMFVGSGPGDPALLTTRAAAVLANAPLVFIDPDVPEPVLAFTRTLDGETVFAAFNLGAQPASLDVGSLGTLTALDGHGLAAGSLADGVLQLPAHALMYARIG